MEARCLVVLGVILVLPACFCLAADEGDRLGQMEREIGQLKSGDEAQIKALESRVAELEGQGTRTADETRELDRIKDELATVTRQRHIWKPRFRHIHRRR